jgi:hypothetical protein
MEWSEKMQIECMLIRPIEAIARLEPHARTQGRTSLTLEAAATTPIHATIHAMIVWPQRQSLHQSLHQSAGRCMSKCLQLFVLDKRGATLCGFATFV